MDGNIKQDLPQESAPKPVSYSRSNSSSPNFFDKFFSFFTKKTIAGLVILVLLIGIGAATIVVQRSTEIRQRAATAPTPPCYIPASLGVGTGGYGDVNGDGKVNSVDSSLILQREAGLLPTPFTPAQLEAADVNDDPGSSSSAGDVNSADAAVILQYDAGLITTFRACSTTTPTPTPTPTSNTPDLIPQNLSKSIASPAVGQSLTFSGQTRNQGGLSAGASTARFCVDTGVVSGGKISVCINGNSPWMWNGAVPVLAAGAISSTLTTGSWVPSVSGTYTTYFFVDISDAVAEADENNNLTTQTFTVTTASTTPTPTTPPGVTATPTPTAPPSSLIPGCGSLGDVNGDEQIDPIDSNLILQYSAGLIPISGIIAANADVNRDGNIDSIDSNLILQYSAGLISTFSGCSSSPTPTPTTPTPTAPPGVTATPTPQPTIPVGNTVFALTIGLDGLGTTGDNNTPNDSSGSNKNPAHPSRNVTVEVFNTGNENTPIANKSGTINYNAGSGKFTGNIDMENLSGGTYAVKVKSDGYLRRRIPAQSIQGGGTNTLPLANLVTGNVNNDNAIDILDYNILISCSVFSTDNHGTCNANNQYPLLSDLDDNGAVNQFDYNLFLRELSVQNGD